MKDTNTFFVCGDTHGKFAQFESEFLKIKDRISEDCPLIMLGDYFDRAPKDEEYKMIQWILTNACNPYIHFIHGNHDEWALSYLRGTMTAMSQDNWLRTTNGGLETLTAIDTLTKKEKIGLIDIMSKMPKMIQNDNIIFSHAGTYFSRARKEYVTDTWGANSSYYINSDDYVFFEESTPEDCIQIIGHWIPLYSKMIYQKKYTEDMRPFITYANRLYMCDSSVYKQNIKIHYFDMNKQQIDARNIEDIAKLCQSAIR